MFREQYIKNQQMIKFNFFHLICIICSALFLSCTNNKTSKEHTTVSADTAKAAVASTSGTTNILFFGTSLTAGMGVDPEQAFPALIQKKIDSIKAPYKVINAGLSGETSADGKNRIDWLLRQPVAIFVLELGANDGLRGIPVKETINNLQVIIDKVKKKYPDVKLILAGMQMPPSMGEQYTVSFRALFPALAQKNKMELVPFLLKDVAGIHSLIQQDGLHPNPKGHQILAENVWTILQPIL